MHEADFAPVLVGGRLGYGCSSLMARTGRQESLRLLSAAFDAGITHFDVARSYGYGEAEGVLGEFISGRRDEVTVTTKLGIVPPRAGRALGTAKRVARGVAAVSPGIRKLLRRRAGAMVAHGRFGIDDARASFEQSLRELRTDHVDIVLLHEPQLDDLTDELLAFLNECVRTGRARAAGVAGGRSTTARLVAAAPGCLRVAQMPDNALEPEPPLALAGSAATIVTHSVLESALPALRNRTSEIPAERLPRLLLGSALRRNPDGLVLVSSRNPDHLRENAALIDDPPEPAEIEALEAIAARLRTAAARTAG
jgi:D-threo-aldose 1-dehydrogenase